MRSHSPQRRGHPRRGLGRPRPTQALPLCVNASSPFRRHGRDHNTCSPALRRDLSHGAGQHLMSASGLRMKAMEGTGWSSLPSDAKSYLSRWWRQRCDPSKLETAAAWLQTPCCLTPSLVTAGGGRLSGEKVESCFLYAPRLLRACTRVCVPVCARVCVHSEHVCTRAHVTRACAHVYMCLCVHCARCMRVCVCVCPQTRECLGTSRWRPNTLLAGLTL